MTYKEDWGEHKHNEAQEKDLEHHDVHDTEDTKYQPPQVWRGASAGVDGGVLENVSGQEPAQGEEGGKEGEPLHQTLIRWQVQWRRWGDQPYLEYK